MLEIPNNYYRTSIKALVLNDQKRFLLTKEEDTGLWDLPGGGLDFGENPQDCLQREIMEEMGIPVVKTADHPSYFLALTSHIGPKKWITNVIYQVTLEHLNFTPSNECVEIGFFTAEEASREKIYNNVAKFTKLFNPDKH